MCLSAFPLQHLRGWEGNHLVTPQQAPEGWWEFPGKETQLVPYAGKCGGTRVQEKNTSRLEKVRKYTLNVFVQV